MFCLVSWLFSVPLLFRILSTFFFSVIVSSVPLDNVQLSQRLESVEIIKVTLKVTCKVKECPLRTSGQELLLAG